MSNNYSDVGEFHTRFHLDNTTHTGDVGPREIPPRLLDFRISFMEEELAEFKEARDKDDIAKMADALVDLVYVAMGTAHLLGLPWQALWNEVHNANMTKTRATKDSVGPRGDHEFDVVKGPAFQPPRIEQTLAVYGWET